MPLPPMYFPVYNLHFRLPEPGLHAQPLIGTPPMMHMEGLHLVEWLASDQTKLTTTILGDSLRFAVRDYDSGKFIPHVPVPVMAGPFLVDTIMNSQYLVLFNQPDLKLEGTPVGVFFWGAAPTWRCLEVKMPFPPLLGKKMKALGKAGTARKAAAEAKKRQEQIEEALDKIDELVEAAEQALANDALSPDAEAKNQKKQAEQQAKIDKAVKDQMKAADKKYDADKWADDVDAEEEAAEKAKSAPPEDPTDKAVREFESDMDAKAAREEEKAALKEKKEADKKAREAQREADKAQARVESTLKRDTTSAEAASESVLQHQAQADAKKQEAQKAQAESKAAEAKAKKAAKAGSDARKAKGPKQRRQELAKDHRAKHGKSNPYKDSTGVGNMTLAAPSILCHIPFPCTIQIYMSLEALAMNWFKGALGALETLLNSWIGFVFDSLGAGRGVIGQAAANLAKGVATGAVSAAKTYITEGKVQFKVSTQVSIVKVTAELSQDPATGDWAWKASASGAKSGSLGEIKGEAKAEGKLEKSNEEGAIMPDASVDGWSASTSAKASNKPYAPSVGYSHSEKSIPEKTDASGNKTPAREVSTDSGSVSVKQVQVSHTAETTTSADGSEKSTETNAATVPVGKVSRSTSTARTAEGAETTTTTDTVNAPYYRHSAESTGTPAQHPTPVNYTGGAPVLGGA